MENDSRADYSGGMKTLLVLAIALAPASLYAADPPASPFIKYVYRYADTMLESGRDVYGPEKSGLFLSALDRQSLGLLKVRPAPPAGIRREDRVGLPWEALVGANPMHDENFLRVLYVLSELSSKAKYREAADAEQKWFLEHGASKETGLLCWGEHMCWNVVTDEPNPKSDAIHEFARPWVLWDRCYKLSPEACAKFARGLWEHQIADHETGGFDRHAGYWKHDPRDNMDYPRHAGFYIRTWADAYAHTKDETFLKAIAVLLGHYEKKRNPNTQLIAHRRGQPDYVGVHMLSMAIDCAAAAHGVPKPLSEKLRAFVDREDANFCSFKHDVAGTGGFLEKANVATGQPGEERSPLWDSHYGGATTAMVAMMCVDRYENSGKTGYRDLLVAAADAYLDHDPGEGVDTWPMAYGHAISLELAAWRSTADQKYFDRARRLGLTAIDVFFQDSPLPRASMKTGHYETITGADTLALALVELHLATLHITAVAAPDNTIDR